MYHTKKLWSKMSHGFGSNNSQKNKQRVNSQLTFWYVITGRKKSKFSIFSYRNTYSHTSLSLFYLPLPLPLLPTQTKILNSIFSFSVRAVYWLVFAACNLPKLKKKKVHWAIMELYYGAGVRKSSVKTS